jgi:hypothetical protein
MRHLALILLVQFTVACGGSTSPPKSAGDEKTESNGGADPASPGADTGPAADVLYESHEAVPPIADSCTTGEPLPVQKACPEARGDLAEALGLESKGRDLALAPLEACSEFPVGLMRALRAELGTPECADGLVASVVGQGAPEIAIEGDIRETLVALGLSGRLQRLAAHPPEAPTDHSKESLAGYFEDDLFPWITRQAQAIFAMSSQGTRLSGYARGVVAIEAGNADMRFVEIAREAPLAKEIAEHEEAKDVSYATLDEQLEPRKARGRNAALVGLREMARIGVRQSARVDSARRLLSKVYGGRRVNALDTLLVPDLEPQKAEGATAAIASRVPTAYVGSLAGKTELSALLVRAHMQMGMPVSLRRQVEAEGSPTSRLLLARALFESGRTYFRSEDFQAVQALITPLLDMTGEEGERLSKEQINEATLLRALSVALVAGPKDAAELIAKGPRFADSLGNLVMLDGLGENPGELGGRAAFDSAYLRELVAPEGAPEYWADLAERYLAASKKLKGSEQKIAKDRGLACREIERTLRKQK